MEQFITIAVSFLFGALISGLVYVMLTYSKEENLKEEIKKEKEKAKNLNLT